MKFTCDYCKTGCSTKGNILSHMRLKHTPHRKFKCAICAEKSKIYNQKKNARIHLKKKTISVVPEFPSQKSYESGSTERLLKSKVTSKLQLRFNMLTWIHMRTRP